MKIECVIVEMPEKCKSCAMRRHRVGIVKKCKYKCPK